MNVDCQRCVNLFPEKNEIGTGKAAEVFSLRGTPGLSLLLTLPTAPVRGIYTASDGELYAVGGNTLYSISPTWVATVLGTLGTSTGPVSICDNGYQVVVVDGSPTLYLWTPNGATFTTLGSADSYNGADMVTFMDGYFIFNNNTVGQNNQFYLSALVNAVLGNIVVSFDGLDFADLVGTSDNLVGQIAVDRQLWLFGQSTAQVWYDTGAAAFPFAPISGAYIEIGCAAKFSIAKLGNSPLWLGSNSEGNGIVFMANGYVPQRISTFAVEEAIQSYRFIGDARAFTYQMDGHGFYVLNFPSANTTWVFDLSTGLWHERAYTNNGQLERHRANCHALAFPSLNSVHVVGDYATGAIYQMSNNVYSDAGNPITRLRTAPHLIADLDRVFYHKFQLDIETGVGIDGAGQGVNPQVILDYSDDGGHKWSNEKWTGFGAIGARKARAIWRRLGQSRDRVFRVKITDPVKVTLIGAELDFEKAAS